MGEKTQDEYVWANYPQEYSDQLEQIKREDGMEFFLNGEWQTTKHGVRHWVDNSNKLHPNWMELYDVVRKLNPSSVFECGFGGGYHLKNIHAILPKTEIFGCDLLEGQMKKAIEFSSLPESIIQNMKVCDMTSEGLDFGRKFEFVYSMAVVMHLSTDNAKKFLRNMAKLSSKYIFMVEGIKNHENWFDMVQETLPEFDFKVIGNRVDNGILMTKKVTS